jgi:probable HAF family extracellular repeat protein
LKSWFLLLAAVPIAAAPLYTITNIGGVGGSRSDAFSVNAFGAVAGTATDIEGRSQGFAYEAFVEPLGTETDARGVNASGAIVGSRDGYATLWKSGSVERIGTLGGNESAGLALNDLGYVTGTSLNRSGQRHAFLAANGQLIDLGTLGGSSSTGFSINNAGQIAGSAQTARGDTHAFVWEQSSGMRDLGTIGGRESRAFGINSGGWIAGASTNSARYFHATVWDSEGLATDLGTLGGSQSYAYGINDSGHIVGWSFDTDGRSRAFVWTGGMLMDLNDLVGNVPGWSLTAAYGINASGQIVGTGTYMGQSTAFRLDPALFSNDQIYFSRGGRESVAAADPISGVPEPANVWLIGAGLLALSLFKKHLKQFRSS